MKNTLTILALFSSLLFFSQTANEFLKNGIEKHNAKDFEAAIEEYSKAMKQDKNLRDAYFNRGICELALKDFKNSIKDFDKTIELDSDFVKAYYSRATVLISQEKYKEAIPDLDKIILFNSAFPNALTLRGQIRAQIGNKTGACEDFNKAKDNGDAQASRYLTQFCGNKQQEGESLSFYFPENENWKIGDNQENDEQQIIDMIHSNEAIDNWTELTNMTSIKGVKGINVEKVMNLMFEESKKNSSNAKLTFIEKNESVEFPWIIFTIESPNFKNDKIPESQLWYIVQGKQSLYTNFRAVKSASISEDQKQKWIAFFKTGKIVYK